MSLVTLCITYLLLQWSLDVLDVKRQQIDLSHFTGRIIPSEEVKPGTFAITVPFDEALTYGSNAILSYGERGIKIWKPDGLTVGIFKFSETIPTSKNRYFKISVVNFSTIILEEKPTGMGYFSTIFFLILGLACSVLLISSIFKKAVIIP